MFWVSRDEISNFPSTVQSLTDSVWMLCDVDSLNILESSKPKRKRASFREMRSIHPSPQRHSAQKRFILEKAYQRAEMPWALRIIWSRFILNSKCNLLNNESPLLPGWCEVKSASVQPKKGLEMNSGGSVKVQEDTWLCAVRWKSRWGWGGCAAQSVSMQFIMKSK